MATNLWTCENNKQRGCLVFGIPTWRRSKLPAHMDQKKLPLNHLFLLLLLLSCLLSLDAAPLSRSLALMKNQDGAASKVINTEIVVEEGGFVNGRMSIELNDYPGSGANSRHDPKNPGKP
ncbi:hypothetical protein Cni_G23511 [Canna indica]|uniref:Uncharacterized protein n=1 Tax=Canna indica TaxID=4628 RepID=A0AAQ3QNP3_9LILI|nr:hypothetical protein Cni_G23511 [Canna indica]